MSSAFGPGPLDDLLVGVPEMIATALGATGTSRLADVLNPAAALGDLGAMFDPSAVTDLTTLLGADLAPNLGGMLLHLLPF